MMPPLYRKASVVVPWLILILQLGSEWSSVCRRRKLDGCKEDPHGNPKWKTAMSARWNAPVRREPSRKVGRVAKAGEGKGGTHVWHGRHSKADAAVSLDVPKQVVLLSLGEGCC